MKNKQVDLVCTNFELINAEGNIISNRISYNINKFIENCHTDYSYISLNKLIYGNIVQGCTYCFSKKVRDIYLRLKCNYISHDTQIMFIGACIGKILFLNKKLIKYRIHESNSVGISNKGNRKNIRIKNVNKTPIMVRFINDLDKIVSVPQKNYYKFLYYLRIPYLKFLLLRKLDW